MIKWTGSPSETPKTKRTFSLVYEHEGQIKTFTVSDFPPITKRRGGDADKLVDAFRKEFPENDYWWVANSTD